MTRPKTDAIRLYALSTGELSMEASALLAGESGVMRIPVPSYLIVHPKGRVIFDTGLNQRLALDPAAYLASLPFFLKMHFQAGDAVTRQIERLDLAPRDIDYLVISHLHLDHVGGVDQFPRTPMIIQRREWQAGNDPDFAQRLRYVSADYDLGKDVVEINGEYDLFGDSSVVCLPTYGHTPGHQSLRVRLPSGETVLTADACYFRRTLERLHLPSRVYDKAAMLQSLELLGTLQARGARLIYGHDPDLWATLPKAPLPFG
jgi:glyoxylase-like metal-dependent hydrolase (beta-lactamase superfamily II)